MHHIRLHPAGKTVPCGPEDTLLTALERAGYALPNNCRAGACGECKVKILEGQFDQGFVLDMALSREERAQGYGLICMAKPLSETIVIEWGNEDARPKLFPPREDLPFVVTDKIGRTSRIVELHLHPLGAPMRFWPGQYVQLGDREAGIPRRSYSIANAPRPDGGLVLLVTRMESGTTSTWIHDRLQSGSRVFLSGPYGTFIGDPSVDTPVLCMAAGSGLAPILSLTEAALRRGFERPVTLLFSARTRQDLYGEGMLAYWQDRYPNFRFVPTLTSDRLAGMSHGRIPDLLSRLFSDLSDHSVFAAGPPPFVEACLRVARELGASDECVHAEGFHPQLG